MKMVLRFLVRPLVQIVALTFALGVGFGCSSSDPVVANTQGAATQDREGTPDDGSLVTDFPTGTIVAVDEVQVSEQRMDFLGNAVTVHGWSRWPGALDQLDPFGDDDTTLFGTLDFGRTAGTSLVAVDVEVCAANDQAPDVEAFRSRFQLVDAAGVAHRAEEADLRASMIFQPVVLPKFSWPPGGQCQRGWQGLEWSIGADPAGAQYTAVSMAESTFGDLYVYRWRLDESSLVERPVWASSVDQGQQQTISDGQHAGLALTLLGWNEVGDTTDQRDVLNRQYVQPSSGNRLVATFVEICAPAATDDAAPTTVDLPSIGLQIDGWNLLAPLWVNEVWGPGYLPLASPSPGSCTTGWVPFDVPLSALVTGVFVTDRYDPSASWIEWSMGEELPAPDIGDGFPNKLLIDTVADLCDATQPLAMQLSGTDEPVDFGALTAVAVRETESRLAVYLSEQTLDPADIPMPVTNGTSILKLVAENGNQSPTIATQYRDDSSNSLYGSIALLDSARPGTFIAFIGATVTIEEINDDYVCGTVSNSFGDPTINGRFGAAIWRP